MKYIQRVDEVVLGPPFSLGYSGPPLQGFKAHWFMLPLLPPLLPTDPSRLQKLVDEQLNAAFPNGPVKYEVPKDLKFLGLVFIRYERTEAVKFPASGWLAYTETLIGFVVRRKHERPDRFPDEFVTYLGVVYIDDSKYKDPVDDPSAVPIVLGREAYGLPKNPGQIFYEPLGKGRYPMCPKLEVWDIQVPSKLALAPAIVFCPGTLPRIPILGRIRERLRRRTSGAPDAGERAPRRPDFSIIARQFGVEESLLSIESVPALGEHAFRVSLPPPIEEPPAIAYDNLQWRTKLVGLKQFPDPMSSTGDACYQVAVESPIEEKDVCSPNSVLDAQTVEFPAVKRVDLMDRFGIASNAGARKVLIPTAHMFYVEGVLLFAEPTQVKVWP